MEKFTEKLGDFIAKMIMEVIVSYQHNWIPLGLAILTAVIMTVYLNMEKLQNSLLRKTHISIWAAVVVGAFTPLCACGTMAVILGMASTALPWGPIMAFLTSSPLMAPDGFILNAGLISLKFAIALTIASIVIGAGSGYVTQLIEANTNFLKNQSRFSDKSQAPTCGCSAPAPPVASSCCGASDPSPVSSCGCGDPAPPAASSCDCGVPASVKEQTCCSNLQTPAQNSGTGISEFIKKLKLREFGKVFVNLGLKQILLYFTIFVMVGFIISSFVPNSFIIGLFGGKQFYGVPLAALIGLPLYVNTESMIPLIKSLLGGGASGGSMLAFMITGPGTSAMVIAGLAVFMKKRALALYVLYILLGGILCGYLYELLAILGL